MSRRYLGWVALFTTASAFSVSCGSSDGKAPTTAGGSAGHAAGTAGKPSAGASSGGSAGSGATGGSATGGSATGGSAGRASAGSGNGGTAGRGAAGSGNGAGRSGAGRGGTGGEAGDGPSDGGTGGESACPEGSDCGDACRDFCEARNSECPTTPTDCDASCNTFGTVAAAADCQAEVDDLFDCYSEPGIDVCASGTCQDETAAFTGCGLLYCATHLSDPACLAFIR